VAGIDKMQEMNIFVTSRSSNLLKEFRKYVWDKDKDGNYINVPIDAWNHGIDASRYYVLGRILGKIKRNNNDLSKVFGR
jgi:phage terminase large subunit